MASDTSDGDNKRMEPTTNKKDESPKATKITTPQTTNNTSTLKSNRICWQQWQEIGYPGKGHHR
jgi:hypothetical protein